MTAAADRLREHLPAEAVDASDVYRFAAAGRVPQCVLSPASVDEAAAAVDAVRGAGLGMVPAGHPTHLDIGAAPQRYDAALTTRRLTRILAHDAADMTVTAEAGVSLSALAAVLAEQGQWLPLDPARAADMTVGGLIAADRSGPLRCAHGKVRDWLIGVRVVAADGQVVRGGGRVVKNVAGYDLPKLFTGSFGTLGLLVEATFKVRPLPEEEALFVWPLPTLDEALGRAANLLGSNIAPVVLEALNEAAAETLGLDARPSLVIGVAGGADHIGAQERRLDELSSQGAERCSEELARGLRRALSDFSHPAFEDGVVARVSGLPTVVAGLLPQIEVAAQRRGIVAEIAAHAANGVAWCQLLGAPGVERLAEVASWVRAAARQRGAWVVFEALPEELRGRLDPWGFDAPALRLMRGVKRALDPDGLFSAGRFVGGE